MVRLWVALLVLGLVVRGGPAGAQPAGMAPEARRHFDQGLRLYNVQSYEDAIVEFKTGYRIDPRPEFLYALAQAQRMNRDCPAAIASYETFLRTGPPGRQEEAARAQIEVCRAEIAARAAAGAPASAAPPGPQTPAALPPPATAPPPDAPLPPPPVPQAAERAVALAAPPEPAAASPASPSMTKEAARPAEPAASLRSPDQAAPLHRRWWFWALIGGAVVAGVGIAVSAGAFTRVEDAACPAGRDCQP